MADADKVAVYVTEALRAVRLGEMLSSAIATSGTLLNILDRMVEFDRDSSPEILAALKHLSDLTETLQRLNLFADARYDAAWERLKSTEEDA